MSEGGSYPLLKTSMTMLSIAWGSHVWATNYILPKKPIPGVCESLMNPIPYKSLGVGQWGSFGSMDDEPFTAISRPHRSFPDAPARSYSQVMNAFSPVVGTPYSQFADLSLFTGGIEAVWERIPQRKAESDLMAARLVKNNLEIYKRLGGLVIVESGGAHSVAISTVLAELGFQPIIKMGLSTQSADKSWLQEIGAMKFYASRMEQAKKNLAANSPAALILDVHRDSMDFSAKDPFQKINDDYQPHTFPSVDEVKQRYHGTIIWVTEGRGGDVRLRDDYTPPLLRHYRDAGIVLYQHFADPYHNNTPVHAILLKPEK